MTDVTPQLRITTTHDIGVDILALRGQLDLATVSTLRDVVLDGTRLTQPFLVLDLNGLDFLDSMGIATLVAVRRRALARNAELVLACTDSYLLKLLRISRLDTVLQVVPSVESFLMDDGVA